MEKFNVKYYEDIYLGLLKDYIKAEKKEDKEKALKATEDFKAMAMLDPIQEMALNRLGYSELTQDNRAEVLKKMAEIHGEIDKDPDAEYFANKNKENYRKVVNAIPRIDKDKYSDDIAKAEIKRIKKGKAKRFVKKALVPVAAVATVIAIGLGFKSCSKNENKSTDITTETTAETTIGPSESFTHPSTDPTTVAPSNNVIPSVSEDMAGIKINEPTATSQTNGSGSNGGSNSGNNGGSNNGGSNNGGSNNGGSNGGSSSTGQTDETTKPTEATTIPTTTPTTTPETTTDPSVPTTEPVETKHTEPSDERNQRDVEVDIHDGENPKYIEEDPTKTYPTYINIPETSKTTEATTTTTAKPTTAPTTKPTTGTVNGMPVEDDPNETYETYFDAGQKTKSKDKTLTLRK